MATKYHQIVLRDIFPDYQNKFIDDSFQLLSELFELKDFITPEFYSAFYRSLDPKRKYSLHEFLAALYFICFYIYAKSCRTFAGLQRFQMLLLYLVYTEPICQLIDSSPAQILTFYTSEIKSYATENNPKTLNALIKKLKVYYNDNPDVTPYRCLTV